MSDESKLKREHTIETVIPNDAADYLEPKPGREPRYAKPLTLPDGTQVDLNKPDPFPPVPPGRTLAQQVVVDIEEAWEQERQRTRPPT
jgi:hypothetical protein